jgi:hypothetical protein
MMIFINIIPKLDSKFRLPHGFGQTTNRQTELMQRIQPTIGSKIPQVKSSAAQFAVCLAAGLSHGASRQKNNPLARF